MTVLITLLGVSKTNIMSIFMTVKSLCPLFLYILQKEGTEKIMESTIYYTGIS